MKGLLETHAEKFVFKEMLPIAKERCSKVWTSPADSALCQRTIIAGRSYARTARIKRNERYWVNITTPSPIVAPELNPYHPPAQCRFDTFVAGALCDISMEENHSFENLEDGICARAKGYVEAARPLCWYKPV